MIPTTANLWPDMFVQFRVSQVLKHLLICVPQTDLVCTLVRYADGRYGEGHAGGMGGIRLGGFPRGGVRWATQSSVHGDDEGGGRGRSHILFFVGAQQ